MRALLVPVKAFHDAKARLAPVLELAERSALARRLAAGVIRAAGDMAVSVVCDDHEVAAFAESLGAQVLWTPGLGLSGAVGAGVAALAGSGVATVVVAHADLPHAAGLAAVAELAGERTVAIVPDRRRDGTNVIALPAKAGFVFSYGPASFGRHLAEAKRLGLEAKVLLDEHLSFDLDEPADLVRLSAVS